MELPHLGQHCSHLDCKQLEFLPIKCKCGLVFCTEHFAIHTLDCAAVQIHNEPDLEKNTQASYVCSHPSCNEKSYIPLLCQTCNKHFCVTHRHITECAEKEPEVVAAALKKFTVPVKEFKEAKMQVDKEVDALISQARKKPKSREMANKLQLMRIKNKATGLKTIPVVDRVYFNVHHCKNVLPIFLSRSWSLGRAIDCLAEEFKISNKNNQSNALKLRLFNESGKILSENLSATIDILISEQETFDGDDLVLEYVDDDCASKIGFEFEAVNTSKEFLIECIVLCL